MLVGFRQTAVRHDLIVKPLGTVKRTSGPSCQLYNRAGCKDGKPVPRQAGELQFFDLLKQMYGRRNIKNVTAQGFSSGGKLKLNVRSY
jgi:hypothetical protein